MLQNTAASENTPTIVQNSFLDVIALASHGLASHYGDVLALTDAELKERRLREFQGELLFPHSVFQFLRSIIPFS